VPYAFYGCGQCSGVSTAFAIFAIFAWLPGVVATASAQSHLSSMENELVPMGKATASKAEVESGIDRQGSR